MILSLRKISKLHLISWCENFVERHNFCHGGVLLSVKLQTTCNFTKSNTPPWWKLYLSTKFSHQEIRWNIGILSSASVKFLKNPVYDTKIYSGHFQQFNPLVPNVPFLYPLKTWKNRKGVFRGVEKGCIESKWVKRILRGRLRDCFSH